MSNRVKGIQCISNKETVLCTSVALCKDSWVFATPATPTLSKTQS
jgi:hypothetical protein